MNKVFVKGKLWPFLSIPTCEPTWTQAHGWVKKNSTLLWMCGFAASFDGTTSSWQHTGSLLMCSGFV